MKRSRTKKPRPERTRPIRDFGSLFGEAKPAKDNHGEKSENGFPAGGSVADAYRVIDDYVRQGRRAAESLWTPLGDFANGSREPSLLTERFLRGAADLSSAWFDMLQTLSTSEQGGAGNGATTPPGAFDAGKQRPQPSRKNGLATSNLRVEVAVQSARLAKATVDVFLGTHPPPVSLSVLHPTDDKAQPITTVKTQTNGDAGYVLVLIRVPEHHPPGSYHGILLAGAERKPCASLTLEIFEE
jgi:hypothetical protein